jgi:hypothetical protein
MCRVLIFGAGSSCHAGGPLAKEIYPRMKDKFSSEPEFQIVCDFEERFPVAFQNYEYLLSMLDLGIAAEISPFGGYSI